MMANPDSQPELGELARAEAMMPIVEWKPDVIE
jgi:hypothetical protein